MWLCASAQGFVSKFETSRNQILDLSKRVAHVLRLALCIEIFGRKRRLKLLVQTGLLKDLLHRVHFFEHLPGDVLDLEREIFTSRLNGFAQVGKVILL